MFYFLPSDSSRLGISISKSSGNAPFRNRVKRIIRRVYDFFPTVGYDVIVVHRRGTFFSFYGFKEDYIKFWKRLK